MKLEPVRKSIEVGCGRRDAFRMFIDEIDTWWPLATHSVAQARARSCVFEGRTGGAIHEIDDDGAVHLWGTVTEWTPPERVVFTWHPGRNAATAQEVELRFSPSGTGTRIDLEHRRWETLGDRAEGVRNGYRTGWDTVLAGFVARSSG